jgi:transposase
MISFNRLTKIFVCKEATDMRCSYDGLFEKTKRILLQDPFSGYLFIFMNKQRTSIKCLFYDGTGFVLICKRLERSAFSMLNPFYPGDIELSAAEFGLFFEGADFSKRFIESPIEIKKSIKKIPIESRLEK